jgi:hypothetical protein
MTKTWNRGLAPALALLWILFASGCASGPSEGPGQSIEQFYRHLNEGNYREAMALYSFEARQVLEDPDTASDAGFAEWAKVETKDGKVDEVRVVQQQDSDDSNATVEYKIIYRDGSSVDRRVTMTLEDGQWKLGLIG